MSEVSPQNTHFPSDNDSHSCKLILLDEGIIKEKCISQTKGNSEPEGNYMRTESKQSCKNKRKKNSFVVFVLPSSK